MKTFDTSDPRLTAYALGELRGEEAVEIEAAIRADASLGAEVEQIRQVASMIRGGFAAENGPRLTEQQRQTIHRESQPVARKLVFRGRAIWFSTGLAAAACLSLALFLTFSRQNVDVAHQNGVRERAITAPASTPATGAEYRYDQDQLLSLGWAKEAGETDGNLAVDSKDDSRLRAESAVTEMPAGGRDKWAEGAKSQVNQALVVNEPAGGAAGAGGAGAAAGASPMAPPPPSVSQPPSTTTAGAARRAQPNAMAAGSAPVAESRSVTDGLAASSVSRSAVIEGGTLDREKAEGRAAGRMGLEARLRDTSGENYPLIVENPFLKPTETPQSTFSVDVDTASYSNVRRFLTDGQLPPKDAVRVEEMINYFNYRYEAPSGETPFSANIEVNQAPWNPTHRLVRIGLKGKEVKVDMRPATSLVFLIDVSGSMRDGRKLPLVQQSMKLLVDQLNADDRLAIVTYAGNAGLVMDSTYCTHEKKPEISRMIDGLTAGGSTNGAGGINVAYDVATQHFIKDGVNRVILCTDGDFNVGVSSEADLTRLIEEKRGTGVYLSVLGFGTGNLQDAKMKQLSKHGNGNYAFIDTIEEGKKVLVDQLSGTLVPIAKDVKVQVEFNPAHVGAYRLIGYEQRIMAAEDFNDDRKDAGEIGAGHTVTALYEIIPPGEPAKAATAPAVDELRFQRKANDAMEIVPSDEMLVVKLRYKPIGVGAPDESIRLEFPVKDSGASLEKASNDFRFAAAVAGFGMILRDSEHKGNFDLPQVMDLAQSASDEFRMQSAGEFLELVERARTLIAAPERR